MNATYANAEHADVLVTWDDERAPMLVSAEDPMLEGVEIAPFVSDEGGAPRTCTPREFRARFTPQEKGALTLAASRGLEAGDPTLQVWIDELNASQVVELDHPELQAGMDYIVAQSIITAERAIEILAP